MQSYFIIDNDSTTNPVTIASSFKDFLVKVGKNFAENIETNIDLLKYIANNVHNIDNIEITEDKIMNIISTMKNSAVA